MDTVHRLLAYANHGCVPSLIREAEAHGWSVHYANAIQQTRELINSHTFQIGVMFLEDSQELSSRDLEKVIEGNDLLWVALIDSSLLAKPEMIRLICQLFYAYHPLPINSDQLDSILRHTQRMAYLQRISNGIGHPVNSPDEYEMVGATPIMHQLFRAIRKVAAVDAPVFISGESGTGKELTARAIHERSPRAKGPFNAINCGSLPTNLIQAELFGYEKGAFTGANHRKIGKIEATSGGTLFLDEIGDLPYELQVNLLRFLEGHRVQRIGSLDETYVDIRVLAATHINLEQAVNEGRFREDLYHRLNVLQVQMPALRDRQDDIELLAKFFFEKFSNEKSAQVRGFSQEATIVLKQYDWPGNIRELINRIRRAMVMCESRLIRPTDLGLERRRHPRSVLSLEQVRNLAEHNAVKAALGRNNFKIQQAAKDLAVSRVTLYRLMEKHHIVRGPVCQREERRPSAE